MKRKRQLSMLGFLIGVCLAGSGCQSTKSLESQWVGKTSQSLLEAWGQPSQIEENSDGSMIYYYTRTFYPDYQEAYGYPADLSAVNTPYNTADYPITIQAESTTAKFWITPEGRIYRVQGRIIK